MTLLNLSYKSIKNRMMTTLLTLASIAVSVSLLLSLERIRSAAKESFESTISGTDLIVGARSSPLQLLLFSVFQIGDPTHNVTWTTFQKISKNPLVSWAIPISLGDSHQGYRVVGTNQNYFAHYKLSGGRSLQFHEGSQFDNLHEVVVGSEVASRLKYQLKDKIILSHGTDHQSFQHHEDKPFQIVGILQKTGTPIDRNLFISMDSMEAIHEGWENGAPPRSDYNHDHHDSEHASNHEPKNITAFFLGLHERSSVLKLQREISDEQSEALTAAMPGVILTQLWKSMSFMENILKILSYLVFVVSILSLLLVLLTSLNERRREMSILRSMGARPSFVFSLFIFESGLVTLSGILMGFLLTTLSLCLISPILLQKFGLFLQFKFWTYNDLSYMGFLFCISLVVGLIPAFFAYKNSVADGLTIKI